MEKMKIFYDGLCPLCTKEINHYKKIDTSQKIDYIDIAAIGFDESKYGLAGKDYNKTFHIQTKDGEFVTAVDGFIAIWQELDCFKPLTCLAKNKLARPFFDMGYTVFMNVRPIFRREKCDDEVCG